MANLVVTCGVRSLSEKAKATSAPPDFLEVAWPRGLPVPWSDVLSFSPDVFAFSSRSAVDAALGGVEAGILLARWRGAVFAAVGAQTATHLAQALSRVFAGRPPRVWNPAAFAENEGLEALLNSLPPEAGRVVVFGAKGGRAENMPSPHGRTLLSAPCYELVPVEGLAETFKQLFARWRKDNGTGTVTLRVGSGAVAEAVCDALAELDSLRASEGEGWLFFEARHASAQALLTKRGLGHRMSKASDAS
jgi:uroporphyrinogen-III synthase